MAGYGSAGDILILTWEKIVQMTVKLNQPAYEYAKLLIEQGKFISDERESWSDHHPSTKTENEFIETNGLFEYGKWFLAVNDEYGEENRRRYEFPYGDFDNVHQCGVLAAQGRAGQSKYFDVENAAAQLIAVIDEQAGKKRGEAMQTQPKPRFRNRRSAGRDERLPRHAPPRRRND